MSTQPTCDHYTQILVALQERGWQIYEERPEDTRLSHVLGRGPVDDLQPGFTYFVFPSVDDLTNTIELHAAAQRSGGQPIVNYIDGFTTDVSIFHLNGRDVEIRGINQRVLTYKEFCEALKTLSEAPEY